MKSYSRELLELELVMLHEQGESKRGLARKFKMSRNTVKAILKKHQKQREQGVDGLAKKKRIPRRSKLDPYRDQIKALLTKYPKITAVRVYEEIQASGYQGGKSIVKALVRTLRPKPKTEIVIRFETEPGKQGQMDWSPYTLNFRKAGRQQVLCFSYILGFSRRQFVVFRRKRTMFEMLLQHQAAFEYFGGVPQHCLYDGEKTVILRWEAGRPVYNPRFLAFLTHYHCRPLGCRPGRPQTKGKVESPFNYVESNLLCGREFDDLDDLNAVAKWWLAERSDRHIHATTRRPPLELFEEKELKALQPLPPKPYEVAEVAYHVCNADGFVVFRTNRYSVPFEYVGEILAVKGTENQVWIYRWNLEVLAVHQRSPDGAYHEEEDLEHRRFANDRYGVEPIRETFLNLGPAAASFLDGLTCDNRRMSGRQARQILALRQNYHSDDINTALEHAMKYGAYEAPAIMRILKLKALPRSLESYQDEAFRKHVQTLPQPGQRELSAYQSLFQ